MLAARRPGLVVIDGPSGAGKSALADALVAALPAGTAELVRLDEIYPGWYGLDAGARSAGRRVVAPHSRGRSGTVERWDWAADAPARPRSVRPGSLLVVEGCGAFAAARRAWPAAVLRVWVDLPDEERRARALARDRGAFDPWWETWDEQWRRYASRGRPAADADVSVEGGRARPVARHRPPAIHGSRLGT
nr:ATP-binding protein [Agromyces seonyuensis]